MHNKEKFPEIWAAKESAENELTPLLEKRNKYTDQIAGLQAEISALQADKNELNDLAMQDAARIRELRDTISRCAIAMGAKTASGV